MSSLGQEDSSSQFKFKRIPDAMLGSIGEVRAIGQDSLGFIWAGGVNGLARWDGYQAKAFVHLDADRFSLSSNSVNALVAGDNGDMWVATYWGLNRYNAATEQFIRYNFNADDPDGLSSNSVLSLVKTRSGDLWLGTANDGLQRYLPETDTFASLTADTSDPDALSSNEITEIAEARDGMLWVGLKGLGVDVLDPNSQKVVQRFREVEKGNPNGLSQAHPAAICGASDGAMWVGTYDGLNRYLGNGQFQHFIHDRENPKGIPVENIDVLMCQHDSVWAAVGNQGVSIYQPASGDFTHALTHQTFVRSIFKDRSGTQWLGFAEGGVARLDRYASAVTSYAHSPSDGNSLSSSQVISIAEDPVGNLWVGTRAGLNYVDRVSGKVERYKHQASEEGMLSLQTVTSLILDGDDLWFGTSWWGVTRLNLNTHDFQRYMVDETKPGSLPNREVWSMLKDSQGVLWLGLQEGKMARYRPETNDFAEYQFSDAGGDGRGRALDLFEDSAGSIWIAGDFGLYRLPREYQHSGSENQNMAELFSYYGGDHNEDGLAPRVDVVRHVFEDTNKNIWVATGGGLIRWSPSEKKSYTYEQRADGLAHDGVTGIAEDDEGYIWVSTEGGISRLDPKTNVFKNFSSSNGLPGNTYVAASVLKTSRGEMAFGGTDGLTILDPNRAYSNINQSPLVLTDLSLFNETVVPSVRYLDLLEHESADQSMQVSDTRDVDYDWSKIPEGMLTLPQAITHSQRIELSYEHSVITFGFALLSFEVTDKNLYSYILEGFNDTWSVPSERREATYTNLDPGEYVFRVRALNNEGLPMHSEINVHVIVYPPWWKTWWAYSLYTFAFLAFFFRLLHAQYQKRHFAEHQNRLLEVKVAERTQELSLAHNELKVAYKKMEEASYTDALTQLRNRHYFLDFMPPEVARVTRIFEDATTDEERVICEQYSAFLVVDIDHFKNINDEYGHAYGDEVLRKVSSVLQACCREGDICIRWGGEEFLVVCSHQSFGSLVAVAERIRASVATLDILVEGRECIHVTCSVGACNYPVDARNPQWASAEQTIALADWCLYLAKKSGRNCCASLQLHTSPEESFKTYFSNIESHIEQGEASVEGLTGTNSGLAQRSA